MVLIKVAELVIDVTCLRDCALDSQVRHADTCGRVFFVGPYVRLGVDVRVGLVKPALDNVSATRHVRLFQEPISVVR